MKTTIASLTVAAAILLISSPVAAEESSTANPNTIVSAESGDLTAGIVLSSEGSPGTQQQPSSTQDFTQETPRPPAPQTFLAEPAAPAPLPANPAPQPATVQTVATGSSTPDHILGSADLDYDTVLASQQTGAGADPVEDGGNGAAQTVSSGASRPLRPTFPRPGCFALDVSDACDGNLLPGQLNFPAQPAPAAPAQPQPATPTQPAAPEPAAEPPPPPPPPVPSQAEIDATISQAISTAAIPDPNIQLAPPGNPDAPLIVQLPTWIWTTPDTWQPVTAEASIPGLTITATATPTHMTINGGQAGHTTCPGPGTAYIEGAQTNCTLTYTQTSAYTDHNIEATIHWDITWTCSDFCTGGTEPPTTTTLTQPVRVAEIQTLLTQGG